MLSCSIREIGSGGARQIGFGRHETGKKAAAIVLPLALFKPQSLLRPKYCENTLGPTEFTLYRVIPC